MYFSVYCNMFYRICWGLTPMCQSWTHLLLYITSHYPIRKYLMGCFSGYYLTWRRNSHIRRFKLSITCTIILFPNLWNYHGLVQSVAHTLRLTNLDLEFASNGKHQRTSSYLFQQIYSWIVIVIGWQGISCIHTKRT